MIGNKKILAVVTARKGSKGIPGKNYRDLLGKPLFLWSMEAALQSNYVDGIILSTNCQNCIDAFEKHRDEMQGQSDQRLFGYILRPDEISTDTSKNEEALIHTVEFLKEHQDLEFDIIVNLQVTSPCRLDGLVDRCIEEYHKGGHDSLLTASKDTPFIWQKKDGKWEYTVDVNNCCDRKMRQEFGESDFIYHDDGNLYITESSILLDSECRIGYNPAVFETTGINSVQIDEEFDFMLIENMAKTMKLESLI